MRTGYDAHDITYATDEMWKRWSDRGYEGETDAPLLAALAAGQLFVQSNDGKFERVTSIIWWRDNDLLSAYYMKEADCRAVEVNESGDIVRRWER